MPIRLNESIVESPLILLLGAGASAPFGYPTMRGLTDEFWRQTEDHSDYSDHLSPFLERWGLAPTRVPEPDHDREGRNRTDPHIEQLLEQLNLIRNTGADFIREDQAHAVELCRRIIRFIRERIRGVNPSGAEIRMQYAQLFEAIGQSVIPVFTTNYDHVIERFAQEAGVECQSGFAMAEDRRVTWSSARFHSFVPQSSAASYTIVLFKLHGSFDWYRDQASSDVYAMPYEPAEPLEHVSLYPAETKLIFREPYFTNYMYLDECLRNANVVVVIGYSFVDETLKERLRSALRTNTSLKVLWFLTTNKELDLGINRVSSLAYAFGTQTVTIANEIVSLREQLAQPRGLAPLPPPPLVTLDTPKVPFVAGQQADFLWIPTFRARGFELQIKIASDQSYWRAGFILAPEHYVKETDTSRSISEYFLFHVGRDPDQLQNHLHFYLYQANRILLREDNFVWGAPDLKIDTTFLRNQDQLEIRFAGQNHILPLARTFFENLYLVAWADDQGPFSIQMMPRLKS